MNPEFFPQKTRMQTSLWENKDIGHFHGDDEDFRFGFTLRFFSFYRSVLQIRYPLIIRYSIGRLTILQRRHF